ncbi:MAG TPA: CaiB/BaiF CoA-transferase family protein [bacterium]|nr:CaiB/BaiF CoA-transferase family protein [bacterium]
MAGPLSGVRVLDLSRLLPGPYCTMLLADLGAEVIKIEDPDQGDYIRWLPPYIDGVGAKFLALNRNKRSATLNLKTDAGREIFLNLLPRYDVVVESFRPGVMDKLGIGYSTAAGIKPGIIYCSLTGYGQNGPYADRAGHDINYIATSGLLAMTGVKDGLPVLPGIPIGDMSGALFAALGILAALMESRGTGRGRHVDISLSDSAFAMLPMNLADYTAGLKEQERGKNDLNGGNPCYGVYETADSKFVCLGAIEPKFFKKFCALAGKSELEVLHHGTGNDREKLEAELTALFKTRSAAEWIDLLEGADVCFGPVKSFAEALDDPQIRARGLAFEVPTGKGGVMPQMGAPFKMSDDAHSAPPGFGEHTSILLAEAGVPAESIDKLRSEGVIK